MPAKNIDDGLVLIRMQACLQLVRDKDNTFFRAKQMDINKLAAARMRARRILQEITFLEAVGDEAAVQIAWALIGESIYLFKNARFTPEPKKETDEISDEDIEAAKRYPIDKLIHFTRGQAIAFCHDDKKPSLFHGTRKNRAICPVCGLSFNPIDVLVFRDGYSFKDAVKQLR